MSKEGKEFFEFVKGCFGSEDDFIDITLEYLKEKAKLEAARERAKDEKGYVYFIYDKDLCKIGKTSDNPLKRFKALRVGNANMEFFGHIKTENCSLLESQLHEEFREKRVRGEWFKAPKTKIKALIDKFA